MVKQKRKISARDLIADIRAGLDDDALMDKYHVSQEVLESLFNKLVDKGAMKRSEIDGRILRRAPATELRICPACGEHYPSSFKECPKCGVVASEFVSEAGIERQREERRAFKPAMVRKLLIVTTGLVALVVVALGALNVIKRMGFFGTGTSVERKAKVPSIDIQLIEAAKRGDLKTVNALLAKGANVNGQNIGGFSPLMVACAKGHIKVVKLLLQKEADKKLRGNYYWGETALMMAAQAGHQEIVELLLTKGADANAKSKYTGSRPLIMAAYEGNVGAMKSLLKHGADVNATTKEGTTALMSACGRARWAAAKLLLENGANINAVSESGTALTWTCGGGRYGKGHEEVLKLLLQHGADVNGRAGDGSTALIKASQHNYPWIVKILLARGADVNSKNKKGETALILASANGKEGVVNLLLKAGADVNARDNEGWTALKYAESKNRGKVIELLKKHRAGE